MNKIKILTIIDVFKIEGKGTVVTGYPSIELNDSDKGFSVIIDIPGRQSIVTTVQSHELLRNCFSPQKPRTLALLLDANISPSDIVNGSEVYFKN